MKRLTITLAVGALLLLLCSNCSFMDKMYAAQKIDQAATPVPFTTLENYFVRNDVDCSKQQRLIIDNKADFEKYFGMAAHMGGMPTEVNWNKQFVIALVMPETKRATTIYPVNVKASGYFDEKRHEQERYWMRETINEQLLARFYFDPEIERLLNIKEDTVLAGKQTSFVAASDVLNFYYHKITNEHSKQ